jgi:hypothetical protein
VSAVTVLVTALAIPKAVKAWDEVLSIKILFALKIFKT